jgi:periplasmic protein TonB
MAYLDRPPLNHRLANLGTAGLIELGLIAALIAGLSISGPLTRKTPPITEATNIPLDPPTATPTPTPQASDNPIDPPIVEPRPPIVINTPAPEATPRPEATGMSRDNGNGPGTEPTVRPNRYKPVAAIPRNNPKAWVTTDDYPARDLRIGNQGITDFHLAIGIDGRVKRCDIVRSSGSTSLDKAACAKITSRARFQPATDEAGAKVDGEYSSSVRWQIP